MEVSQKVALNNPSKNRNDRYLPGTDTQRMKGIQQCYYLSAGDQRRVVLRGDKVDYIHAVFVNVKTSMFFHWCWNRFIVA